MAIDPSTVDAAVARAAGHDEMARLDAQLAARPVREKVGLTIRAIHRHAAETIARRHHYDLHAHDLRAVDVGEDGLVWVEFWPWEG